MKKRKKGVNCYSCGRAIKFHPAIRSPNNKWIPLELDGSKHNCPKSPYNNRQKEEAKQKAHSWGLPYNLNFEKK